MAKRDRTLFLNVKFKLPRPMGKKQIARILIDSIERRSYKLPKGWRVAIEWRNGESSGVNIGTWKEVLTDSRKSSRGFDIAVRKYLENQL